MDNLTWVQLHVRLRPFVFTERMWAAIDRGRLRDRLHAACWWNLLLLGCNLPVAMAIVFLYWGR